MALHVSNGGMQMIGWRVFIPVIRATYATLKLALAAEGCVHAEIFRDGRTYFALSVWSDREAMRNFGKSDLHARLMTNARHWFSSCRNENYEADVIPSQKEAQVAWRARHA